MSILLNIFNTTVDDAGVYTLQATAGTASQSTNLTLVVQCKFTFFLLISYKFNFSYFFFSDPPIVKINGTRGGYFEANSNPILNCVVHSYSSSNVTWKLKECNDLRSCLSTTTQVIFN
jgi:hypothetical protein